MYFVQCDKGLFNKCQHCRLFDDRTQARYVLCVSFSQVFKYFSNGTKFELYRVLVAS